MISTQTSLNLNVSCMLNTTLQLQEADLDDKYSTLVHNR